MTIYQHEFLDLLAGGDGQIDLSVIGQVVSDSGGLPSTIILDDGQEIDFKAVASAFSIMGYIASGFESNNQKPDPALPIL